MQLGTTLGASDNSSAQIARNLRPIKTEPLVGLKHQYFFKAPQVIPMCGQMCPSAHMDSETSNRGGKVESGCETKLSIFKERVRRTQELIGDGNERRWNDLMTGDLKLDVFRLEGKEPGGCSEGPGGHLTHLGPVTLWEENTTTQEGSRGNGVLGESEVGHVYCEEEKGLFRDEVRKQEILPSPRGPCLGFGDFRGVAMRRQKHVVGCTVLHIQGTKEDPGGLAFLQ